MSRRFLASACTLIMTFLGLVVVVPASARSATPQRNPVVVVAGLFGPASAYQPLASRLRADGNRVFVYQLPQLGVFDIARSARAFADFVDGVRASTASAKVDLVAHSEGGLVSRYYIKVLGGLDRVDSYVSLGTPQYGTAVASVMTFYTLGSCLGITACIQMQIGSGFLAALNADDDAPGAVRYTTVFTMEDQLVRPVGNAALTGGATNVLLQRLCPLRLVGHVGLILDGAVYTIIRSALAGVPISAHCLAL